MIRIAVVGEIGSGKTFVSNLFGFPVFNADNEVAKIYKKNRIVYRKLRLKLPKFVSSFPVNKKNIITAIKYNPKNLKIISNIIHPVVRKQMRIFLKKNYKRKAIVLDIPLYFENNLNKKNDIVIFVSSKKKLINQALKKRKKSDVNLLKKLSKLQKSLAIKKKKSDYVIENNFRSGNIRKKVGLIKKQIFNK
ncbi:dephospho-CoA kinase [Candidatus Pelagibacter sp.]|nr:dephospho-CoA kinase [Candidatus Pelagibacter sp.]